LILHELTDIFVDVFVQGLIHLSLESSNGLRSKLLDQVPHVTQGDDTDLATDLIQEEFCVLFSLVRLEGTSLDVIFFSIEVTMLREVFVEIVTFEHNIVGISAKITILDKWDLIDGNIPSSIFWIKSKLEYFKLLHDALGVPLELSWLLILD
jgi:hypothetical protein